MEFQPKHYMNKPSWCEREKHCKVILAHHVYLGLVARRFSVIYPKIFVGALYIIRKPTNSLHHNEIFYVQLLLT